ncbi:MAG: hypothetical protein K0R31_600 [Clostridiales bacterium]|nr:hypothetical protein [Clostridiales bacterium]
MKVLRGILVVLLVFIIIGGLGYIGWSMFYMPMNHQSMNTPSDTTNPPSTNTPQGQMPGMQMPQNNQQVPNSSSGNTNQSNVPLNTIAIQNKDKLNQAIGTINQAIDLITIDPYSKATVSGMLNGNMQTGGTQTQPGQGTGTINIYPSGNSSVNIAPPANNSPNNTTPSPSTNMGAMAQQQNTNYVFDQGKLQQLHNGIYTLAQGMMAINQLNDDLAIQSASVESNPPDYQTYIMRYNTSLQNKTKLNNAVNMINQANTLVNINPYASPNGYQVNVQGIQQLHQGIFKLAQGMTMLSRLNDDLTSQMAQAAQRAQSIANMSGVPGMTMPGTGLFGSINLSTLFNIILIVMVIGLVIGVFGAIVSLFKNKPSGNGPVKDPNA